LYGWCCSVCCSSCSIGSAVTYLAWQLKLFHFIFSILSWCCSTSKDSSQPRACGWCTYAGHRGFRLGDQRDERVYD
jgi:hypothetical protein